MPRLAQRLGGAAGRYQLDAVAHERGGKLGEARLVADGQQGAADGNEIGHGEGGLLRDGKDAAPLGVMERQGKAPVPRSRLPERRRGALPSEVEAACLPVLASLERAPR